MISIGAGGVLRLQCIDLDYTAYNVVPQHDTADHTLQLQVQTQFGELQVELLRCPT